MPYLQVNKQKLFFSRQANGEGPENSIILIHGAGGSHLDWPPQLRRVAGWNVYAIDLPGHGRSDIPGRSTISAYSDDILSFIDALRLERAILVGHSMGGAIALMIGLNQPSIVDSLVLISTGARLKVAPFIKARATEDYNAVVDFVSKTAWSKTTPKALVSAGRELMLQADPFVVHGDFEACDNFDVMARLSEVSVPTLVIGGTADLMTPPKFSHYLAGHIPDAELAIIEGGGHMVALEQPDVVEREIAHFLERDD